MNKFKIIGLVKKVSEARFTREGVAVVDLWMMAEDEGRQAHVAITLFNPDAQSIEPGMTIAIFGKARTFKAEKGPDEGRWITKLESNSFEIQTDSDSPRQTEAPRQQRNFTSKSSSNSSQPF